MVKGIQGIDEKENKDMGDMLNINAEFIGIADNSIPCDATRIFLL